MMCALRVQAVLSYFLCGEGPLISIDYSWKRGLHLLSGKLLHLDDFF